MASRQTFQCGLNGTFSIFLDLPKPPLTSCRYRTVLRGRRYVRRGGTVSSSDRPITRITRTLSAITSQVFRCHGLMRPKADADNLGIHDIAYWLIFLSCLAGWFLFYFAPQRERLGLLDDRRDVLAAHLAAEKRELKRLERSVKALQQGDPFAWERAARGRMGWVEPGEITDISTWLPRQASARTIHIRRQNSMPSQPLRMAPPPSIPSFPVPSSSLKERLLVQNAVRFDALGPIVSSPPKLGERRIQPRAARTNLRSLTVSSGGLRLAAR